MMLLLWRLSPLLLLSLRLLMWAMTGCASIGWGHERGAVSASVVNQGYIAIDGSNQQNVLFPSVAVNSQGKGVVAFSVVGLDLFPSTGYAPIDVNGTGAIRISALGALPDDGFTGYAQFGASSRVGRWGDYSAAVSDEHGTIWMGNEYIPNALRTANANWGTFIGGFTPQ